VNEEMRKQGNGERGKRGKMRNQIKNNQWRIIESPVKEHLSTLWKGSTL